MVLEVLDRCGDHRLYRQLTPRFTHRFGQACRGLTGWSNQFDLWHFTLRHALANQRRQKLGHCGGFAGSRPTGNHRKTAAESDSGRHFASLSCE